MMFENNLQSNLSLRSQIARHLPIAIVVLGGFAAFVAMHVALTGVVVLALAHVLVGLVLLVVRRHRGSSNEDAAVQV